MFQSLDSTRARILRIEAAARQVLGAGFEQSFLSNDGSAHTLTVSGVKSPSQLEDELLTWFIWVWALKDYLKEAFRARGFDPEQVEQAVNDAPMLQYVADIANRAKHDRLRTSRSGEYAELVDVGLSIPQTSVNRITVGAFNVDVEVATPSKVQLRAFVRLNCGVTHNAFIVLSEAIDVWESKVLSRLLPEKPHQ
jgi:hypothetical protein